MSGGAFLFYVDSMRKKIIILISTIMTSGCLEVTGDGNDAVLIPDIQIECPGLICSAASSQVMIGFIKDTTLNCENYLSQLNSSNYFQSFDAYGTVNANSSGPILSGTVTNWFDFNGSGVSELSNGAYRLCGHYDLNNNQFLDPGEAVGEALIYPGTSPQVLSDWFNI